MNPEMTQLLFYAGFALLGWWLRHQGIVAPKSPTVPPAPSDTKPFVDLLKALLDRLAAAPPATPPAPAGTVITVPFELHATARPSAAAAPPAEAK